VAPSGGALRWRPPVAPCGPAMACGNHPSSAHKGWVRSSVTTNRSNCRPRRTGSRLARWVSVGVIAALDHAENADAHAVAGTRIDGIAGHDVTSPTLSIRLKTQARTRWQAQGWVAPRAKMRPALPHDHIERHPGSRATLMA
jgi:hypothetical protein